MMSFPNPRNHSLEMLTLGLHPKHKQNLLSFLLLFQRFTCIARMPKLLNSILNVSKVFQKYAEHHGEHTFLSKEELKQLLLTEFGNILRVRYTDS